MNDGEYAGDRTIFLSNGTYDLLESIRDELRMANYLKTWSITKHTFADNVNPVYEQIREMLGIKEHEIKRGEDT